MDLPDSAPLNDDRLYRERASRMYIQRIFASVMADRWDSVFSIFVEARDHSAWMATAVWAGLPNTVKEKIRETDSDARRTD